ncbi:hypothetical protein ACGFYO_03490 [Streptomyces sp. NPDC048201]|uniref:hypothetical protein n=1 Tax=Streptomyces sp. NPDC048201 TaxID=3365513 RepID=UPI0037237F6F
MADLPAFGTGESTRPAQRLIGTHTVELGAIPCAAPLKIGPAQSFCALDDRLAVAEGRHAEL